MLVIRSQPNNPYVIGKVGSHLRFKPKVVGITIGNFDAFHIGHQQLFRRLSERLRSISNSEDGEQSGENLAGKIICSFYPHPRRVLHQISRADFGEFPELWPLLSWRMRFKLAEALGFSAYNIWHFTQKFSQIPPEEFVERFLVRALGVQVVVVGHDWSFGKDRAGNTDLLKELGQKFGFEVEVVPPIILEGRRVSTRWFGDALKSGDVLLANRLLGRNHSIIARVIAGDKRGRDLGFPTANCEVKHMILPRNGVYACLVYHRGEVYQAVTNIGVRPTIDGVRRLMETHILDRKDLCLYSDYLEVAFVERLRDEMKFSSLAELRSAIADDILQARDIFARTC